MTPRIRNTDAPITLADLNRMSHADRRPMFVRIASALLIAVLIIILATASGFGGRT